MPATRQIVVNALRRTGDAIADNVARFPADRWQDFPVRGMGSLRDVLQHLIECEDRWLESIGVEPDDRLPPHDFAAIASATEMAALFASSRAHLIAVVERLPEAWFHAPSPARHYGHQDTGADLLHCAAEHTSYHDGQIQMLETALPKRVVWLQHQDADSLTPFDARVQDLLRAYGLDLTDVDTTHANKRGDGPERAEEFVRAVAEEFELVRVDETFGPTGRIQGGNAAFGMSPERTRLRGKE